MIEFKKTPDPENTFDNSEVTVRMVHGSESLSNVIEEFENFLRGVGFVFKGNLQIVEEEVYEAVRPDEQENG